MKYLSLLILAIGFSHCSTPETPAPKGTSTDTTTINPDTLASRQHIEEFGLNMTIDTFPVGDVNGDGKQDLAFIQPLSFYFHNGNLDSQFVYINFNCDVKPLKYYDGFEGIVVPVGDLDGNGSDEILYYPDWYQSNSAGIFVYGYKENEWRKFGQASFRRDRLYDEKQPLTYLRNRVKKIDNNSFKLIGHWFTEDGDIVDTTKVIEIP